MTITEAPAVEELERLLETDPPRCELYDPPRGAPKRGWSGRGVRCPHHAVERWRLICPTHGPALMWLCQHHIDVISRGLYAAACGRDVLTWERC